MNQRAENSRCILLVHSLRHGDQPERIVRAFRSHILKAGEMSFEHFIVSRIAARSFGHADLDHVSIPCFLVWTETDVHWEP